MSRTRWSRYDLAFKRPSGTSRGVLISKTSYFLITDSEDFTIPAIGECSLIAGLSPDPMDSYEATLDGVCDWLNGVADTCPDLSSYPSIFFGLETLLADQEAKGSKVLYPSSFTSGEDAMQINGLIWMGEKSFMREQIKEKIGQGFECIKMKIGAIDFDEELDLLKFIRTEFGHDLELRVDANGAFNPSDALEKLKQLHQFDLHSIEQPIKQGQWEAMAELCSKTPFPIALDEEIIGISDPEEKDRLLTHIQPQYIILKPSLHGGLEGTDEWIALATSKGIGWWNTSALESNIGLNAIAQYTYQKDVDLPQGLGTGGLYTNNLDSPLYIQGQMIHFAPTKNWDLGPLQA